MFEEREELVKRVFPQLRAICEQRAVTWSEIDLRWGITGEDAGKGRALSICLDEVDNCRPYFIALLGDRYGWTPDRYPEDLLEERPWIKEHLGKSITELEILYGALGYPGVPAKAFFYLRDGSPPSGVASPHDLRSDDEDSRRKLAELKDRVQSSGFRVHHYREPVQVGRLLLEDFRELIEVEFPERPPTETEREEAAHQFFVEALSRVYVPQKNYFELMDVHAAGEGPPLVVVGPSGSGKSALLANWAWLYLGHSSVPAADPAHARLGLWTRLHSLFKPQPSQIEQTRLPLFMHFVGSSAASSDWAAMLRRIMSWLKQQFALELEIPESPDELRAAFAGWMNAAAQRGRFVLVIDGADQLERHDEALAPSWLPSVIPAGVRLILSTRRAETFSELRRLGWSSLEIEPLDAQGCRRFVVTYLGQYSKRLSDGLVEKITRAKHAHNPLYLRTLLEELRQFGRHEQLEGFTDRYLAAGSSRELYGRVLARMSEDYERERPGLVADTVRLIWAARQGLSESELADLLGNDDSPLPSAIWSPLYLAMKASLVSRSGLLTFFHQDLRAAAEEVYLPTPEAREESHAVLADYFSRRGMSQRKVEELPSHLAVTRSWQKLYELLAAPNFLMAAWAHNQFEVRAYWTAVEANSPLRMRDAYRGIFESPEADSACGQIVGLLLTEMGYFEEALSLTDALERQAARAEDEERLQVLLGLRARLLRHGGNLRQALDALKAQEELCRRLSKVAALAASLSAQGVILREAGELDVAAACFSEEARLCLTAGDLPGLSANYGNQGMLLFDKGDLTGAMSLFQEQERLCRQLGDLSGLQKSLGNQGVTHTRAGKLKEALAAHAAEEHLCRRLGDLSGLQASLGNQALVREKMADYDGALELLSKKEALARRLGDPAMIARTLAQQAHLYGVKLGLTAHALPLAEEAQRLAADRGLTRLEQEILTLLLAINSRGR